MKKTLFLFCFIISSTITFAQETYTVKNETLSLKTEVEGTLDLLWNTFDGKFRYFIKNQNNELTELKNTKSEDNKYQEEYKTTLSNLTSMNVSKVSLTTYSLKSFIDQYNSSEDANYISNNVKSRLKLRLGVFGGITNNPFNKNPKNEKVLLLGTELEAVSDNTESRHAGFLNIRHTTETDDFKYSATQFALGYRYRFIKKETFNVYGQTKFATLTASKITTTSIDPDNLGELVTFENSTVDFDAALIFGLGADIKLGNGYLTLVYDSLFALFIDNQGNFPIDFAIGYKFNL